MLLFYLFGIRLFMFKMLLFKLIESKIGYVNNNKYDVINLFVCAFYSFCPKF